jgi:hypothetical protein
MLKELLVDSNRHLTDEEWESLFALLQIDKYSQ